MAGLETDSHAESLRLWKLSKQHGRAYRENNAIKDLEHSIADLKAALIILPKNATEYWELVGDLSFRLNQRFEACGERRDLEESIELRRQQLDNTPNTHEDFSLWQCVLSDQLWKRYDLLGEESDLVESVQLARVALANSTIDDPQRSVYLITAEQQLLVSFDVFGTIEHLDEAVAIQRERLATARLKSPLDITRLNALSLSLLKRHKFRHSLEDLEEALQLARETKENASPGWAKYAVVLQHLGNVLAAKWEVTGSKDSAVIEEALVTLHEALRVSDNGAQRAGILVNLMCRARERYETTGHLSYLEEACGFGRQAVQQTDDDDKARPMILHDLAICLNKLGAATGKLEASDEAIEMYRAAATSSKTINVDKAPISHNLSCALQQRYQNSGSMLDVKEAIDASTQSVSLVPHGHNSRAIYLNTLGNAWSTLFERSKDTADLDQSIIHAQQALQECSPLEPDHGMFSNNLSTKLWERFLLTEIEEDRDEALRLAALAFKETQPSNTRRPQYLHNLGARYYTLYLRSDPGAISDLDRSISLAQQCLDATPHSHSEWSDYATSLGWRLLKRAGELENWDEFDLAVKTFVSAFENETALPVTRVEAGRTAGLLLMTTGRANWPEADRIYRSVIGLLSRVSPRSISRDDMQHRLQGLSNMSSFAAGAALTVKGDPEDALLLLELGRSVIAGLQTSQRSDLPALLASNEDLGRRYTQLRDALSDWRSFPKDTDIVRLKQTQEAELTKLEDEIRQQEGLELFNLPPSGDQLRALAVEGPLICFNVTKWRSNAFIVTGRGVESVALPLLEEVDLKQYVNHIIGPNRLTKYSGLQQKAENSKKVRSILEWLWNVAVKAVLDHLELSGLSDSIAALPRLWWGHIVLHPSLKALAYARERRQKLVSSPEGDAQPKVLIVDMPHTPEPGWNDLRTAAEVMAIQTAAETAKVPATLMEQPSVTNVLSAMKEHPIVHFACHGDPNTSDPSQTSLVLWQDEENAARLSVGTLFDQNHKHSRLAYLSACSTAQQYVLGLIDESIHLGSAFQLMGFPDVVATLWEADDSAAASIAADFYNGYLEQYSVSAPTGDAARCLHDAVAAFRTRKKGRGNRADDVIAWAPFVHIGA